MLVFDLKISFFDISDFFPGNAHENLSLLLILFGAEFKISVHFCEKIKLLMSKFIFSQMAIDFLILHQLSAKNSNFR